MNLYIPNRLLVTPTANNHIFTKEIIDRVKIFNPNVEVIYSNNQSPSLPLGLAYADRQKYLNETILICTRSKGAPFNEVFSSPGNIAENIGIMGKIAFHCPLGCEFCYIQVAGRGTPWNRVYVDLERFHEETVKEEFVHKICLTLWSAISFYKKESLQRIPKGFKYLCDNKIRKGVLSNINDIDSHQKALKYLQLNLKDYFAELGIVIDDKRYDQVVNSLSSYYNKNKNIPLWINISEYSDVLGLEHLTGTLEKILSWCKDDKDLHIKLRTKSPNISSILKKDNLDRLKIAIDLNTNHVIKYHQSNCFSLNDRISAASRLIDAGVNVQLIIEPIIKYKYYENDYKNLIAKIDSKIDLSMVESIHLGCVRYKTQLLNYIKKVNPNTNLFSTEQNLIKPLKGDKRWRYSIDDRIKIYTTMINSLKPENRKLIRLGAENPDVWEKMNIDSSEIHSNTVFQFNKEK